MKNIQVNVFSRNPMIANWLEGNCDTLGWNASSSESLSSGSIALVDVSSKDEIERIEECENKKIPVVIFSRLIESKLLGILFEREINGFIHMSSTQGAIQATLEAAAKKEQYFDEKILTFILSNKYRDIYDSISSLSNRELEIVDGIMNELTNDEIAEQFDLSVRTVNAHKRNILQKLKARSLVGVAKMMMTYSLRYS